VIGKYPGFDFLVDYLNVSLPCLSCYTLCNNGTSLKSTNTLSNNGTSFESTNTVATTALLQKIQLSSTYLVCARARHNISPHFRACAKSRKGGVVIVAFGFFHATRKSLARHTRLGYII